MKLSKLFKTLTLTTIVTIASQATLFVQQNKVLAGAGTSILNTNETLSPGESIISPDGQFRAILQYDGNFVVYDSSNRPRWNSKTANTSANLVAMQSDCNLVVYAGKTPLYASDTTQGTNCLLAMQDDGNLVIYRPDNTALWVNGQKLIH